MTTLYKKILTGILSAVLLIFLGSPVFATNAAQVEFLAAGVLGSNGKPLSSGKVYTFTAGSSVMPQTCWTAADKSTAATNPVILDAYGRSTLYCDGNYRFILKDYNDVTVLTLDNFQYRIPTSSNAAVRVVSTSYSPSTSDEILLVSTAAGHITLTLPTAIGNTGLQYTIVKTTADANTVIVTPYGAQTVAGAASYTESTQYDAIIIVSDGSNWQIQASNASGTVTLSGTQTLSNKTLTTPVMASFYQDAGKTALITVPAATGTLVTVTASQTLTNKDLSDSSNTLGIVIPIRLDIQGTAIVQDGVANVYCHNSQTFTGLIANSQTAPTGANLIFTIKNNGSLVVTGTINAGSNAISTVTWASGSDFSVVAGDILAFNVTQVGSTIAGGNDLLITLY